MSAPSKAFSSPSARGIQMTENILILPSLFIPVSYTHLAHLEYNPDTFRGKTVLLPCDDPEWSNFTKFYAQNFEMLGLKKLISTSYASASKKIEYHQITLLDVYKRQS